MSNKIAVVTGSNKGIGYGIAKRLLQRGIGVVYLTSRDVSKGLQAVEKLKKEGYNPEFHQLDITDKKSIEVFADHLKKKYGGIDILINNAGVVPADLFKITYEDAKRVIDTNYKSVISMQQYLFPILKDNARVINVSSDCGHLSNLKNPQWIKELSKDDLKVEDINAFVEWFLNSVKNDKLNKDDFAEENILPYRVSKVALCALTRVQQRSLDRGISVNSIHPGFVKTDMTAGHGDLTVDEASEAPVYLALDVDQSVKGKYFWYDKSEKDWTNINENLYCKVMDLLHAKQALKSE